MKKELDKELYPDYIYPEFTPDPNEPFREPIAKLGKKITDRIPQKLGLKKITRNDPNTTGKTLHMRSSMSCRCMYRDAQNFLI